VKLRNNGPALKTGGAKYEVMLLLGGRFDQPYLMPSFRSRDFHQPVLSADWDLAGPADAVPPVRAAPAVGLGAGSALGAVVLASAFGGASGSFQSAANGCLDESLRCTTSLTLGWPATARWMDSLVA